MAEVAPQIDHFIIHLRRRSRRADQSRLKKEYRARPAVRSAHP
ncbi:MAG: hypothetical protein QOK20_1683 [Acidimicrobiaceae bacterium]|jgi:hypothetical protein|nr:hypothetical protein [Acidimicrobiaceae bacterium]